MRNRTRREELPGGGRVLLLMVSLTPPLHGPAQHPTSSRVVVMLVTDVGEKDILFNCDFFIAAVAIGFYKVRFCEF